MLGDFVLQTKYIADYKLTSWKVRSLHVTIYTIGFFPITLLTKLTLSDTVWFLTLLWVTHFITDSRQWASGQNWSLKPILIDQSLHVIELALLGVWFFERG
jgi:hypothetical protein